MAVSTKILFVLFENAQLRKLTISDGAPYISFQKECKTFTIFFLGNLFIALLSGYLHGIPDNDDPEVFYAFAIFENICSQWKTYFSFLYRITFPVVAYVMILPIYTLIYGVIHLKSQIYYLKNHLLNINKGYDITSDNQLYYNQDYQLNIKRKLVYLYILHVKLFL